MEHYYSPKQTSELRITEFDSNILGNDLHFKSGSGVFSIGHLDKASSLLIEKCKMEDGWRVLDIGCGYGPIGIALAKANPTAYVLMSDVNIRAVKLAKDNVKLNSLVNCNACISNLYAKIPEKYDSIVSNPPILAGREVCLAIIDGAKSHLKDGGYFQIVARHNKGGKPLEAHMETVFGNVETLCKKSGYRVYCSKLS